MASKINLKILSVTIAVVALWGSVFAWLNVYGYDGGYSGWRGFPFPYYTWRDFGPPFSFRHPWAIPVNSLVGIGSSALIGLLVYHAVNARQDSQGMDEKSRNGLMRTAVSTLGAFLGATTVFIGAFLLTTPVPLYPDAGFVAPLWPWAPALAAFLILGMPFLAGLLARGVRLLAVLLGAWLLASLLWQILLPGQNIVDAARSITRLSYWYYGVAMYWLAIAVTFMLGRIVRRFGRWFTAKSRSGA